MPMRGLRHEGISLYALPSIVLIFSYVHTVFLIVSVGVLAPHGPQHTPYPPPQTPHHQLILHKSEGKHYARCDTRIWLSIFSLFL